MWWCLRTTRVCYHCLPHAKSWHATASLNWENSATKGVSHQSGMEGALSNKRRMLMRRFPYNILKAVAWIGCWHVWWNTSLTIKLTGWCWKIKNLGANWNRYVHAMMRSVSKVYYLLIAKSCLFCYILPIKHRDSWNEPILFQCSIECLPIVRIDVNVSLFLFNDSIETACIIGMKLYRCLLSTCRSDQQSNLGLVPIMISDVRNYCTVYR